ncbi:MAG: aminotransferase class V-fold PLP-dependent enzyme, partial [Planctomycetota bacterium]
MRAEDFTLDPELCFLNHGSFGAVPRSVQAFRTERLAALERDPIRYLAPERELEPKLDAVRAR